MTDNKKGDLKAALQYFPSESIQHQSVWCIILINPLGESLFHLLLFPQYFLVTPSVCKRYIHIAEVPNPSVYTSVLSKRLPNYPLPTSGCNPQIGVNPNTEEIILLLYFNHLTNIKEASHSQSIPLKLMFAYMFIGIFLQAVGCLPPVSTPLCFSHE